MKKPIISGVVILCVAVGYYAFSYLEVDRKESLTLLSVATLDGDSITELDLLNNVPPLLYAVDASPTDIQRLKLAYYIQEKLFNRLAAEFKIDISNKAIISYANKEFDHVFNPTDAQINLTNVLIQALREVVENKRPIEAV
ncbi:MAG: hypothetical protein Q9M46_01860, partial [Ghiorsea sp.]|nr:hypothetical protein [Ghiorsea sp.]